MEKFIFKDINPALYKVFKALTAGCFYINSFAAQLRK